MNGHEALAKLTAMTPEQLSRPLFATFGNDDSGNAIPVTIDDVVLSDDLSVNGLSGQIEDASPVIVLNDENGELDLIRGEAPLKTWRGTIEPDGVYLDETRFANWPDTDGSNTIRVQDEHGDAVERVDRDSNDPVEQARWQELRDLMPDDALYFQPEGAGDVDDDEVPEDVRQLPSYAVYRNYDNAAKAHPNSEILGYQFAEIEEPKFMDVETPTLYWNEEESEDE